MKLEDYADIIQALREQAPWIAGRYTDGELLIIIGVILGALERRR